MRTTANRQIRMKALTASRRGKNFDTDKGGGSGRIGTRIQTTHRVSKDKVSA